MSAGREHDYLERLPGLHALLEAHSFEPGADRWLSVNDLLLRLHQQGRLPPAGDGLRALLGPLFCTSRDQQARFRILFEQWLAGIARPADIAEVAPEPGARKQHQRYEVETRRWRVFAILGAAVCAVGLAAYQYHQLVTLPENPPAQTSTPPETRPVTDRVVDEGPAIPIRSIPPRQPPEPERVAPGRMVWINTIGVVAITLPALLGIAWVIVWLGRWRTVLKRQPSNADDPLGVLAFASGGSRPFWGGRVPRALHRLRRGAPLITRRLDARRTVERTVRHAGLFSPVRMTRRWRPEYLMLVDRRQAWDHGAGLARALSERLAADGLAVHAYEYAGDPSRCYEIRRSARRVHSLRSLQGRHPNARLILTGDGEGVFHPLTAAPLDSLEELRQSWPVRGWLTTRAHPWGYREAELAGAGFAVAPLTGAGVEALSSWFDDPSGPAPWFEPVGAEKFPPVLTIDSRSWLAERPPEEADLSALLDDVRRYLGPSGWTLLQAIAAYPGVHAPLTVALDQALAPFDDAPAREQRLLRLSRLPWCRAGRMPDYLRLRLLRDMDREQRAGLRDAFEDIFRSRIGVRSDGDGLPIAGFGKGSFRQFLRDLLRFAPAGSTLEDRIFANVVRGGGLGMLDFELPEKLAKRLPYRRWKLAPVVLALLVAAATCWGAAAVWERWVRDALETRALAAQRAANAPYTVHLAPTAETLALARQLQAALRARGYQVEVGEPAAPDGTQPPLEELNRIWYAPDDGRAVAQAVAARLRYLLYGGAVVEVDALPENTVAGTTRVVLTQPPRAGGVFDDDLAQANTSRVPSFTDPMKDGGTGPVMVRIPAGRFAMGPADKELGTNNPELPTHPVTVPAFALGRYEVSFEEYERFAEATGRSFPDDRGWGRGRRPVINVRWEDARAYAAWLSEQTGARYRLPTEAEWEYAARAGTTTPFSTGECIDGNQANFNDRARYAYGDCPTTDTYRGRTVEVDRFTANPFGLRQMHGNVFEWTQDCWHEDYEGAPADGSAWETGDKGDCARRVVRGGSWINAPEDVRSANRSWNRTNGADDGLGFRLARDL